MPGATPPPPHNLPDRHTSGIHPGNRPDTKGNAMATNKRKVMLPHTMDKQGVDIVQARDDIETVIYPAGISQADLLPQLTNCAGIALSGTPFKQTEMDASPAIQVVARIGVGYDAVEVPALTARHVPLMVAGTANSTSVAEQAFHLMIALAKKNAAMDRLVKDNKWTDRHSHLPMELSGKTVLIIGFGRIGTRSARRCQAFDMNVMIFDPYVDQASIAAAGHEAVADLDAALPRADFVSIHCPKSPPTIGLINADRLARMKKGAFLVNTARGGIIDEPALYDALKSGHIGGAGLDVFDVEPTPVSNNLLTLDTVIASPHMAGVTVESIAAMAVATARNILGVLDGNPNKENAVNPEVFA
jgi:D-3-phosphoglycerate dehydrogenase